MKRSTKSNFSKTLIPVLGLVVGLSIPSFLTAQGRTQIRGDQPTSTTPTASEVYSWARTAKSKLPTSDALSKARPETARQRNLLSLTKRGKSIIDRVIATGETMSKQQAVEFDKQMQLVVEQMDKADDGKTTSDCFAGCDKTYPGWGGGKGWNRFWCKVGCLTIEIHIG